MSWSRGFERSFSGLGRSTVEVEVHPVPRVGRVERLRAFVVGGNATEVSVELRTSPGGTGTRVLASSKGLKAAPYEENPGHVNGYWYSVSEGSVAVCGTLYLAVDVDVDDADNEIVVDLVIKNLVGVV